MKKILIGKVISAFGIKGEVKVMSYCNNANDIEKYPLFDDKNNALKLKITNKNKTSIGFDKEGNAILIAKFLEINDRNEAEKMRGKQLFTNRKDFAELSNDEYYQVDLIGLDVVNNEGKKLGKVLAVLDFGGGAMLEIEFLEENKAQNLGKIENFPFKNEFFPKVDVVEGFVEITLPEVVVIK